MSRKYSITAYCYDKKGVLISTGENSYTKTHPKQKLLAERAGHHARQYLHAEVAAIIKARGKAYRIFVEREDKEGNSQLAKPCPVCELAIKEAGIREVGYTT